MLPCCNNKGLPQSFPPAWTTLGLLVLTVGHFCLLFETANAKCIRRPMDSEADRTVGSNGFQIKVLPNNSPATQNSSGALPEGYVPGQEYIVHLEGWKAQYTVQTFRGFSIVAIRAGTNDFSQPIGKFKIQDNQNVKISTTCWHAVTHTSRHPKTEVSVLWQAPAADLGCVEFRGMVLEYQDIWYMDEGPLTKKFCPLIGHEPVKATQEAGGNECCACDEAKYELTFEGIWSRQTHPKDYPTIDHLLHFSDIIGASHSPKYSEWAFGSYATDGLKELAEWGNTHKMEQEMKKKAKEMRTIIKARGLWFPNVQGTTRAVFRTDKYHHLLSLASMIGPSPDWLVGISAVNLCLTDCTWLGEKSFDLYPWDAGTDSGHSYMSPNRPTLPREPIKAITTKEPPNSPFYDPDSATMTPLAKLTIKRQQVYNMECNNANISHYENAETAVDAEAETSEDLEFNGKPGCEVGGWSPWSECSATCGKGLSMRSRSYANPVKAQTMGCKRDLVGKKFCSAALAECHDSEAFNDVCAVSEWSDWTECSVTCGKGLRSRQRQYENAMALQKCTLELMEKEMCIGSEGMDCSVTPDPRCRTTPWSDWSPCSVTCGEGMKSRSRLLFYPENEAECSQQQLMEKQSCKADVADCQDSRFQNKEEICTEPMDQGQCTGVFPRYFYDVGRDACTRFIYTGCKGNRNNFYSLEECRQTCLSGGGAHTTTTVTMPDKAALMAQKAETMMPGKKDITDNDEDIDDQDLEAANGVRANQLAAALGIDSDSGSATPVDCMVTEWSSWSECTKTCGKGGRKQRIRMVKVHPRNGGQPCPPNLIERVKCSSLRPCPLDCKLTPWSAWSECSVSCGTGFRMRQRRIQTPGRRGGADCSSNMAEKQVCRLNC